MQTNVLSLSGRTKLIYIIFGFVFLFMFSCDVLSQSSNGSAHLTGFVVDKFGSLMPGVRIIAKDADGKLREAKTNGSGVYEIILPEGLHSIVFKRTPFKIFEITDYQIPHAGTMRLDVSLFCEGCEEVNSTSNPRSKKSHMKRRIGKRSRSGKNLGSRLRYCDIRSFDRMSRLWQETLRVEVEGGLLPRDRAWE